jgi:hypothetical protein
MIVADLDHLDKSVLYVYTTTVYHYINRFKAGDKFAEDLLFRMDEGDYMWFAVDHVLRTEKVPEHWFRGSRTPDAVMQAWRVYNAAGDDASVMALKDAVREHRSAMKPKLVALGLSLATSGEPTTMFFYQAAKHRRKLFGPATHVPSAQKFISTPS